MKTTRSHMACEPSPSPPQRLITVGSAYVCVSDEDAFIYLFNASALPIPQKDSIPLQGERLVQKNKIKGSILNQ